MPHHELPRAARRRTVRPFLLAAAVASLGLSGHAQAPVATADVNQLSVASGGTQTITLSAGASHALDLYFLFGSLSGTQPGLPVDGLTLPLNLDPYFLHTATYPNSPPLTGSFGILSSALPGPGGKATATFTLPPNLDPLLVGQTVHHAFVVLDWGTGVVTLTSNAVAVDLVGSSTPTGMAHIPAGTFDMGDHKGVGYPSELPLHTVSLSAFYMDVFETTNEDYAAYLNSAHAQGLIEVFHETVYKKDDSEPFFDTDSSSNFSQIIWNGGSFSVYGNSLDHPVVYVSWYGAVAYANWRSAQDGLTPCYDLSTWTCDFGANGYRLPTEAEWEYAARGGLQPTYYQYPWGNTIDGSQANYSGSSDPFENGSKPRTTPVGYYDGTQSPAGVDMANGFGLYDTSGNVFEWCNDWYSSSYYAVSPSSNPHGPGSGSNRVIRGGSWDVGYPHLRSADRIGNYLPQRRHGDLGFRLVRVSTE